MKYVKLIAKPDTWFKAGTEVYHYDCDPPHNLFRVSLSEWDEANTHSWGIDVRGIRINQEEYEVKAGCGEIGEERWDGELCSIDEFESEIVEESK
jgi:hypothetical protein